MKGGESMPNAELNIVNEKKVNIVNGAAACSFG
jgi:hypothetical protein